MDRGVLDVGQQVDLVPGAALVLGSGYEFEVCRPDTRSGETQMVPFHARFGAANQEVMNASVALVPIEPAIAVLIDEACPNPTVSKLWAVRGEWPIFVHSRPEAFDRWLTAWGANSERVAVLLPAEHMVSTKAVPLDVLAAPRDLADRSGSLRGLGLSVTTPMTPMRVAPSPGNYLARAAIDSARRAIGVTKNLPRARSKLVRHLELILSGVTGRAAVTAPSLHFSPFVRGGL